MRRFLGFWPPFASKVLELLVVCTSEHCSNYDTVVRDVARIMVSCVLAICRGSQPLLNFLPSSWRHSSVSPCPRDRPSCLPRCPSSVASFHVFCSSCSSSSVVASCLASSSYFSSTTAASSLACSPCCCSAASSQFLPPPWSKPRSEILEALQPVRAWILLLRRSCPMSTSPAPTRWCRRQCLVSTTDYTPALPFEDSVQGSHAQTFLDPFAFRSVLVLVRVLPFTKSLFLSLSSHHLTILFLRSETRRWQLSTVKTLPSEALARPLATCLLAQQARPQCNSRPSSYPQGSDDMGRPGDFQRDKSARNLPVW